MKKKILITAGSTVTPIDKVRVISNVFKGKTGANIAKHFKNQGCDVTIITSNPSLSKNEKRLRVVPYKTFDDLEKKMEREITSGKYDVIIHSAAVSDYKVDSVHVRGDFGGLIKIDSSSKVSSSYSEMYLRLVQTKKLVDLIREPWGFKGILVKFKLQVGISDEELIKIAKKSKVASNADMIVANCLEWSGLYAYIIDNDGVKRVSRRRLAGELYKKIV